MQRLFPFAIICSKRRRNGIRKMVCVNETRTHQMRKYQATTCLLAKLECNPSSLKSIGACLTQSRKVSMYSVAVVEAEWCQCAGPGYERNNINAGHAGSQVGICNRMVTRTLIPGAANWPKPHARSRSPWLAMAYTVARLQSHVLRAAHALTGQLHLSGVHLIRKNHLIKLPEKAGACACASVSFAACV